MKSDRWTTVYSPLEHPSSLNSIEEVLKWVRDFKRNAHKEILVEISHELMAEYIQIDDAALKERIVNAVLKSVAKVASLLKKSANDTDASLRQYLSDIEDYNPNHNLYLTTMAELARMKNIIERTLE